MHGRKLPLFAIGVLLLCLALAGHIFAPAAQAAPVLASSNGDRDDNLFTEGFEGDWLPTGWAHIQNHASTWNRSSYDSHSGSYSAAVWWNSAPQDEWIVTPALDLNGAINPKLEWYERGISWETGGHHYIMVSTTSQTDPAAFTIVSDMYRTNHTINGLDGEPATVNISAYAGESTVYVAFRYTGNSATNDSWLIDDVRVYTPSGHDVGATAVLPDGDNVPGGSAIDPQVTVENFGIGTETFNVQLIISESGTQIYSEVMSLSDMAPGAVETLNFPGFTPENGNYYDFSATTLLGIDEDAGNDSAFGGITTYAQTHVPMGFLFTNSGCGPCVGINQAMDSYIPTQGNDVALLRIHVWWPFGGDIMYLANMEQSQYLVNEFDVSGVPNFFLDAFMDLGTSSTGAINAYNDAQTWMGPMYIDQQWNETSDELTVTVHITGALRPGGDYRLFCNITEDGILHNGGNGEPIHNQAFRYMYPDAHTGISVPAVTGNHSFVVDCPLDAGWVYDNLRASVYVRDMSTGVITQAATNFLTEIADLTNTETPVAAGFGLLANHPNPFNPTTTIEYSVEESGPVSLRVYDTSGRLIRTLHDGMQTAGRHSQCWDGRDEAGRSLASGLYFVRLQGVSEQDSHKILLAK